MDTGSPDQEVFRYLAAARELEEALRHNKADFEFANGSRQGETLYIADTNVVVHYLEESRRIKPGEFSFGDFLKDGVPAQVNDQPTIEYLLSNALPGQRGASMYLTPPHWNEIIDRASDTARKLSRLSEALIPQRIEQFAAITDPAKKIEMAKKFLPDWIMEALTIAPAVRRRLVAAFNGEPAKLAALDHAKFWSAAVDRIRTSDERDWKKRVIAARSRSRSGRSGRTNNLHNDVRSLAIIQALYRENPEACGNNRTVTFLFVTADRGLYRAIEDHREMLEKEGIPMFARHPRVFSPLLNFSSMSQARPAGQTALGAAKIAAPEVTRVFAEVESTLQRLLVFDAPGAAAKTRRWQQAQGELEASLACWSTAARQLAVAQAHFFYLDSDAVREAVKLLESPEALEQLRNEIIATISSIRDRHVRFQSLEALRRLAPTISKQKHGARDRRAPIQVIGVDLLEPVRNVLPRHLVASNASSLYDLLDHLESATPDSKLLEMIGEELLKSWGEPLAQLLACCLYLAADAWPSARECAARCRETPGLAPALRREADYCFALASRFMLEAPGIFDVASKALFDHRLSITRDKSLDGQLALLRYNVEHAALLGAAATLQAIDDATPFTNELGADTRIMSATEVRDSFDGSHSLESEAREILDDNFSGPLAAPAANRMIETLRLQLFTNIVGTEIFRYCLGKRVSDHPFNAERLQEALKRLEQECPGPWPRIVKIYIAVAHAILDHSAETIAAAAAMLDVVLRDPDLSYCDQIEYKHLRERLQHMRLEITQVA